MINDSKLEIAIIFPPGAGGMFLLSLLYPDEFKKSSKVYNEYVTHGEINNHIYCDFDLDNPEEICQSINNQITTETKILKFHRFPWELILKDYLKIKKFYITVDDEDVEDIVKLGVIKQVLNKDKAPKTKNLRDWVSKMIKSQSEEYLEATRLAHSKISLDQISNIEIRSYKDIFKRYSLPGYFPNHVAENIDSYNKSNTELLKFFDKYLDMQDLDLRNLQTESSRALASTLDGSNRGLATINSKVNHDSTEFYKVVLQEYIMNYGDLPSKAGPGKAITLVMDTQNNGSNRQEECN